MVRIRPHIPRDEKIDKSIPVIIGPGRSSAETSSTDSSFFRYVLELATSQIAVQDIVAIRGDVQIRESVIVEIAGRNTHSPAFASQTGGFRDIGKMKDSRICILMIERHHQVATFQILLNGGIVYDDDIELPIVVAIEERDAASAHCFKNV